MADPTCIPGPNRRIGIDLIHVPDASHRPNRAPGSRRKHEAGVAGGSGSAGHRRRRARLITRDAGYSVGAFAARAKTWFAGSVDSSHRRISTLDALRYWHRRFMNDLPFPALRRLESLGVDDWAGVIKGLPGDVVSDVTAEFIVELLEANRVRILEVEWN